MKPEPLDPKEALRRAEHIVLHDYQMVSETEARRVIAGLLELLNQRGAEGSMRQFWNETKGNLR